MEYTGWECPRCGKIHAPWASQCDCVPPIHTDNTTSVSIPSVFGSKGCDHVWLDQQITKCKMRKCIKCGAELITTNAAVQTLNINTGEISENGVVVGYHPAFAQDGKA